MFCLAFVRCVKRHFDLILTQFVDVDRTNTHTKTQWKHAEDWQSTWFCISVIGNKMLESPESLWNCESKRKNWMMACRRRFYVTQTNSLSITAFILSLSQWDCLHIVFHIASGLLLLYRIFFIFLFAFFYQINL